MFVETGRLGGKEESRPAIPPPMGTKPPTGQGHVTRQITGQGWDPWPPPTSFPSEDAGMGKDGELPAGVWRWDNGGVEVGQG